MPIEIVRHDITQMQVDAIVNAANESLLGGGGVDGAIHRAAGPELLAECQTLHGCRTGDAKITKGYALPCRYVIHTVGPVWRDGSRGEESLLRSCYEKSLSLAREHGCLSVAFPLISSGAYGYPKDQVLKFAVQTITEFLLENELMVYICVYDRKSYSFSQKLFNDIRDFIDDEYAEEHDEDFYDRYDDYSVERAISRLAAPPPKMVAKEICCNSAVGKSLKDYMNQMDRSFQEMLFALIDESGMTDVECYKKANVDKRIFSKIKSNKAYRPSKQTAVAFAISLQLDLDTTQELLATVGMTLSRSNVFDKIIRYFIHNKNYNIFEINEALFEFDQTLLGSF